MLRKVLEEAKKQHYSRLIAKSNNKIKTKWNTIRRERKSTFSGTVSPPILVNDEKLEDPTNVANAFISFFIKITEHLNIQQMGKGDAISVLKDSFPGNFPSIKIISNTETEIKCIIPFL